ncbi:MAG: RNA polymerase sigma factor [Deltaproteobacteria bacterium]|nr:RNA polymerase sigma factor [Deltaproteobacteria bacterium]
MTSTEQNRSLTDGELMERLANGRIEPLGELYLRHSDWVMTIMARHYRRIAKPDLEDLCQEVFLAVHEAAPRYKHTGSFKPWLYGIALRKARSYGRKTWVRRMILEQHRHFFERPATSRPCDPNEAIKDDQLTKALSTLPAAQREVLLLHTLDGFSGEEIADAVGIEIKTVWTRLHRARSKLRKVLNENTRDATHG